MDGKTTTLDHVDKITVPGDVFCEPENEYWVLLWLWQGMEFLFKQAERCDRNSVQKFPSGGFSGSTKILLAPQMNALLTSAFHWYSISACQYVRTVGAIAHREDNGRPIPSKYSKRVIPEVEIFRDKFAAHFAWNSKHKMDNDAERLASIVPQLTFHSDHFYIASSKITLQSGSNVCDSGTIRPWNICIVHERLRQRYWPQANL